MGPELTIALAAAGGGAWLASWNLARRVSPTPAPSDSIAKAREVSVIVPARNEAANLPGLLDSLWRQPVPPLEILVVDDDSSDGTADIATAAGAKVISPPPLPEGWRGKAWACQQGALAARGRLLLFLDADCRIEPGGLDGLLAHWRGGSFSVSPWHEVRRPHEQFSAFFNSIMTAGSVPHGLLGPVLLTDREAHLSLGGHERVKNHVLENHHLAPIHRAAGLPVASEPGRGLVRFRMYPDGLASLVEGWGKGFSSGAAGTPRATVVGISVWMAGLAIAAVAPLFAPALWLLYLAYAWQAGVIFRRVGSFSSLTALLFPVPLAFYLGVFIRSLLRARRGKAVTWKGRSFHGG